MNKTQKIIWSVYLAILILSFLLSFYTTSRPISNAYGLPSSVEVKPFKQLPKTYTVLGWIPFLIAHFIWKDKNERK